MISHVRQLPKERPEGQGCGLSAGKASAAAGGCLSAKGGWGRHTMMSTMVGLGKVLRGPGCAW